MYIPSLQRGKHRLFKKNKCGVRIRYEQRYEISHNTPRRVALDLLKDDVWVHTVQRAFSYPEAWRRAGKTILDHSWEAHAAEYERSPEMW